jgi:dynein heavy chain, axonemal
VAIQGVDSEFKELLKELSYVPGVIKFCMSDGREQAFSNTLRELEKCQKALNEYLEKKKKIFPRFYFVSNVALLDILSNGNNPPLVMPHLGSVFDGISNLELEKIKPPAGAGAGVGDEEGSQGSATDAVVLVNRVPKTAMGMISKDNERVEFHMPFSMVGAVENWLNELVNWMQQTLKIVLEGAITDALSWDVDKPREEWLFAIPAQLCLLASQVSSHQDGPCD